METIFHFRVRAVVYNKSRFLIVRPDNDNFIFLPGGHVETGESITRALGREMMEECGRECEIKEYLGAIENAWIGKTDGIRHWEIVHFFHVTIPDLEIKPDVVAAEEHFEFLWATTEELETLNLLPLSTRDLMKTWAAGDKKIWWASTMEQ